MEKFLGQFVFAGCVAGPVEGVGLGEGLFDNLVSIACLGVAAEEIAEGQDAGEVWVALLVQVQVVASSAVGEAAEEDVAGIVERGGPGLVAQ